MQFCPTFYYLDTLYLMSCRSCYCTFLKLNLRYAPIPRVFHHASSNVLFTWLNHLPDFLCCDTLPLKRNLRIPSYLTLPTVPASRLPTGEQKVADVVFGRGEEGVFCLYLCERGDESVFFFGRCHLVMHVSVCLHENVLMCVTGADSYVRGEVTPSLLSLGVCRGLCHLSKLYQQAHSHPAP